MVDINMIVMYKHWYNYTKPKYRDNAIDEDLAEDVETRFDSSKK